MIPLRDNIPSRTAPVVNYGVIAVCALVFLVQLNESSQRGGMVERYGLIPARVLHPDRPVAVYGEEAVRVGPGAYQMRRFVRPAVPSAVPPWMTLFTCILLHGGWLHIIGNMWFLHIFGDNVEDRFGHLGYLFFYTTCGVAASAIHLASNPSSTVPTIGASGAIAGVMGAYFYLYPRAMVLTLVPIFFILQIIVLPAPLFLGLWFLMQFLLGSMTSAESGGVAWWAHIGGFVTGVIIAAVMGRTHHLRPPVDIIRPNTDRIRYYRVR